MAAAGFLRRPLAARGPRPGATWLWLLWLALGGCWPPVEGADRREADLFVGYLFNLTAGDCAKISLPTWMICQERHILGLPFDNHYGERIMFSLENVTHVLSVKYQQPWWRGLSRERAAQMFVSGLKVHKPDFTSLGIARQVQFLQGVRVMMEIGNLQGPVVIPSNHISSTVMYVTTSPTDVHDDFFTVVWSIGENSISNSSLKSLQSLENKFITESLQITSINIRQWFVGFIHEQHKIRYRRNVGHSELVAFIEGSGHLPTERANQFIKRTPPSKTHSNGSTSSNKTTATSLPVLMTPLLPIKMNALQIMNYVIPENTFELQDQKSPLKIVVFFHNNSAVSNDPTRWISFNSKDQNIRINPKLLNIGETTLKVCAYNLVNNFVCDRMSISVSSPPPQHHQIYVSKSHKDYFIRYTMPLPWFNRFGVKGREDILVESATGNSPFDWDPAGNLEILDIASLEGKLIELILKVKIRNESQISIHLTLPVVAINRQKLATGPLYRSHISFRPDNLSEKRTHFQIRDFLEMLKQLAEYIGKYLEDQEVKVQIFSPLQAPIFFDKVPGQRDEVIIFDWFFHVDSSNHKLCTNPNVDKLVDELLFRSFSSFLMINLTVVENRFGWACPSVPKTDGTTRSTLEGTFNLSTSSPSEVGARVKAELSIVRRFFPGLRYTNFTVTAGLPFKSYVFRKSHLGKSDIKEMRLQDSSSLAAVTWMALSKHDFLFGLPLQEHVRESPYRLQFLVKVQNSTVEYAVPFLVNVIRFERSPKTINHRLLVVLDVEKTIRTDMDYRWRLVTEMDKYVRERCEAANDCGKDLVLVAFEVATSSTNSSLRRVTATVGVLSLLATDSRICPKLSLIRLNEKMINTASSDGDKRPNFAMRYVFRRCGLGEVIQCHIILGGACLGVDLQPPDLGQITVFALIPFQHSLRPLSLFYNTTVWFTIISEGAFSTGGPYYDWISVDEESTALVGVAMPKHAKADPYLLQLSVHSNAVRQVISPRIAVTVRPLKDHMLFVPHIQQPNHQILLTLESKATLAPGKNPLFFKVLFSKATDHYLRPQCPFSGPDLSSLTMLPCGSNLLFQNFSKTDVPATRTFTFSVISELLWSKATANRPPVSVETVPVSCPLERLVRLQRALLGDNGSQKNPAVLPAVIHYYYKSNLGKVKDIRFDFLGPCAKYQSTGRTTLDVDGGALVKSSQNLQRGPTEDRHMFLMATIVPTCSFIIISLCVGLLVACCLQRRNQKFHSTFVSDRVSVEFAVRGGSSPIILAGEFQHSYMPPSRPLILQNEKPPVPPPDYIAENDSPILADEDS